jgi:hypothetical protein
VAIYFGHKIHIFIPKNAYGEPTDLGIIPKKNSFFTASLNQITLQQKKEKPPSEWGTVQKYEKGGQTRSSWLNCVLRGGEAGNQ